MWQFLTPVGNNCQGDWAQMSRQMAARHILGSNGPWGQSQKFVAHHRLTWQMSAVCFCIYWALIIHICEELCICALPGRLELSHLNDVVILWFMFWYRRVQPKGFGVVCFFLFLLCFTAASLKSGSVRTLVFYVLAIYDQWKLKFSLTEGGSGKARPLEDPQTVFLFVSGEMREGRNKRQRLHELLMVPYSWNLLLLLSGCTNSCDACDSCWAVLCGSWDMVFFFSGCGCQFLSLMLM